MRNALDEPQNILILGGTSDIGVAVAEAVLGPRARRVVLACRDVAAGEAVADRLRDRWSGRGVAAEPLEFTVVRYDAIEYDTHVALLQRVVEQVGDLDLVVFAAGVLGIQEELDRDPAAAAHVVAVNHAGGVSTCLAVAGRLRDQGHGALVVLSSVAGERVRRANFVYGGSKAGLDGFAQGLADSLEGTGARVLVVRPGFVRSAMTEGLPAAPFATTPEAVGAAVARALRTSRRTVWVPGVLRFVFAVFRHLPGPVWRRLPIN